jgi:hypothetical protein
MSKPIYTYNYRQNLINYWQQFYPNWDIPKGYHVHHIKPKSLGGTNHPKNLIALHPDDHISIHRCRGDKILDNHFLLSKTKHTKNTKSKISSSNKGKYNYRFTGYYIYKDKKFESAHQLCNCLENKISLPTIILWCKNSNNKIKYPHNFIKRLDPNWKNLTYKDVGFDFIQSDKTYIDHKIIKKQRHNKKSKIIKSNKLKGINHPKFKGYYCYNNKRYTSISDIKKDIKIGHRQLTNIFNDVNQTIKKESYKRSDFLKLFGEDVIGKSYGDIGFNFISCRG